MRVALTTLLCAATCFAGGTSIKMGSRGSLVLSDDNVVLKINGKITYDARRRAKSILAASPCYSINYRVLPLSKIGNYFSYLEEVYMEGEECGASGSSYGLRIQTMDLRTNRRASVLSFSPQETVLSLIKADGYSQKVFHGVQNASSANTLNSFFNRFHDWNSQNCERAFTPDILSQFYVFHRDARNASVRLALSYTCPAPADEISFPIQLGLKLSLPSSEEGDFAFDEVRGRFGEGVLLKLEK